jgi:hypothetical protein
MPRRPDRPPRPLGAAHRAAVLLNVLLAAVVISGCTGRGGSGAATSSPTSAGVAPSSPSTIGQPPLGKLSKLTRDRLAPDSARVDLVVPSFSHPTRVTNPLFPISTLNAVIVEEVGGEPLKIETTLLPETKTVEWNGRRVEAVQSQFCADLKGRITEVAVDLYAQADDGSVWYLGEDVVDDWAAASATVDGMTKAWNAIRAGGVPPRLGARISQALEGSPRRSALATTRRRPRQPSTSPTPAWTSSSVTGRWSRSTWPASTSGPVASSWTRPPGRVVRAPAFSWVSPGRPSVPRVASREWRQRRSAPPGRPWSRPRPA